MTQQNVQQFTGNVRMKVQFNLPIPDSRKCKKHTGNEAYFQGTELIKYKTKLPCKKLHEGDAHVQRPDLDNLLKSAIELQGILYADDSIISELIATKTWAKEGSTTIEIEDIE